MNTTLRTNINLLINTLRTASLNLADDAARNVEIAAARKTEENETGKEKKQ